MPQDIHTLHHVTALAGDPQRNLDFYIGLLGMRLVKKTVNFDAPDVYHFYYGDETGQPGTILTFFPFPGIRPGRQGTGQTTTTRFAVPVGALPYWQARLQRAGIQVEAGTRFGEAFLAFSDPDGLGLALVETPVGIGAAASDIDPAYAIRGFHSVELTLADAAPTAAVLTELLGYAHLDTAGLRQRYGIPGQPAARIDLLADPQAPRHHDGGGTVHHIAFRTADDDSQFDIRNRILQAGLFPSQVMDRQYFHSIYFREPGGVLFEVATDPPGFLVDESPETLGLGLKLPPWEEPRRDWIAQHLRPVDLEAARRSYADR
ncbi:MAG: ring-cleaving dioxygenase [Bacteroidia bacterium]